MNKKSFTPKEYLDYVETSVDAVIDFHGYRVQQAIDELDIKIPEWRVAHECAKIIHGKGTGALRQGLIEYFKKSSFVKSYDALDSLTLGFTKIYF